MSLPPLPAVANIAATSEITTFQPSEEKKTGTAPVQTTPETTHQPSLPPPPIAPPRLPQHQLPPPPPRHTGPPPHFPPQHYRPPPPFPFPPPTHAYPPPPPPPPTAPWTEHRTPDNIPYWHNVRTGISVWQKPAELMASHMPAPPPGPFPPPYLQHKVVDEEKAVVMKPVPSTTWFIVLTSYGNEYYHSPLKKESLWVPPQELLDALEKWKASNGPGIIGKRPLEVEPGEDETEKDNKRVKEAAGTEFTEDDIAYQLQCMEEEGGIDSELSEEEVNEEPEDVEETNDGADESNKEEEVKETKKILKKDAKDMSTADKAKAFMQIFHEMDVSPFAVWEKELPKIIHDWRYTLIPTLKERKNLFDEYCKERAVEVRIEKKSRQKDALAAFRALLTEAITKSTSVRLPKFEEFQRKHKRDPRFTEYADLKEREKVFKEFIKLETERRKNGGKKADVLHTKTRAREEDTRKESEAEEEDDEEDRKERETAFRELLKKRDVRVGDSWRRTKREIDDDPRYRAIRSSDDREKLFRDYIKRLEDEEDERRARRAKKAREEAALKSRAAAARNERERISRISSSGRSHARHDDALRQFRSVLVDMVRDPDAAWRDVRDQLDKRMSDSATGFTLPETEKLTAFQEHVDELYGRRLKAFREMLEENIDVSDLLVPPNDDEEMEDGEVKREVSGVRLSKINFSDLPSRIRTDSRATRVSNDEKRLDGPFKAWVADRRRRAQEELTSLIKENNFIAYHAKQDAPMNYSAVHDVLKEDKRYDYYENIPQERDRLIRELVEEMIKAHQKSSARTMEVA